MLQDKYFCVYDFETCAIDPYTKAEPTQLAALMLHPTTLKVVDTFNIFIRVLNPDNIEEGALKVTRKTKEELLDPNRAHPKKAIGDFVKWIEPYKTGNKKSNWNNPIPCGHNIVAYDNVIMRKYLEMYNYPDVFHPNLSFDTYLHFFAWLESRKEVKKLNADFLREYLGSTKESKENAHDALADCKECVLWVQRLINLYRTTKVRFAGALKNASQTPYN